MVTTFTLLHLLFYSNLAYHWKHIQRPEKKESFTPFSIIIPVRNETENMSRILKCLKDQNYPEGLYEVIVVDDFSDDNTVEKVKQLSDSLGLSIHLIWLQDESKQGKKYALTEGVKVSRYENILITDADCWMGSNWLKSYNDAFEIDLNMVVGPVAIEGKNLFGRLQQIEFSGLVGFGAVTILKENPSICSGANLGFKKWAFEEVRGYENNLFIPSGDDEFLLFNIMKKFPFSTYFLKVQDAIVYTSAHMTLSSFINQRIRWASKWKYNKNWKVRLSAVLFFFDYLFFYMTIIGGLSGLINFKFVLVILLLRCLSAFIFVFPVNRFLRGRSGVLSLIIFQIIYPLHVLFVGINSIFGSYTWKGRKY